MSTTLRYAEYYDMQETLDTLYEKSRRRETAGIDLLKLILSKENILLAYRSIKRNTGSNTAGTDRYTIKDFAKLSTEQLVDGARRSLDNYVPQPVRRVEIPKPNGERRPLGIPTMRDRLIQQMIKQIIEPICEAQFYAHSYGFRPNRSAHHAIARCHFLINITKNHYVVDIDIKSFFNNVNHTRLLKQLWNIGIKDKRVLGIIAKMLKAPIKGVGIPEKGTPQGGILSPLLANVALNDLDWWISNQWENMKTKRQYTQQNGRRALKQSKLKQMYIVRYADDFKVFTNTYQSAFKILHAVTDYLKTRLKLEISPEKSSVTNFRKRQTDFLDFSLMTYKMRKRHVAKSTMAIKRKKRIKERIRSLAKTIKRSPTTQNIMHYNVYVFGIRNYFCGATLISRDFYEIAYACSKTLCNCFKSIGKFHYPIKPSRVYQQQFKGHFKTWSIHGIYLYPIGDMHCKRFLCFNPKLCDYTEAGRNLRFKALNLSVQTELAHLLKGNASNTEYFDNRLSRYSMQQGKCAVTGNFLQSDLLHCHHVIPKYMGDSDKFDNLICIHKFVHYLVHATTPETITNYLKVLKLNGNQLEKVNQLRKSCNLFALPM
ncbi:group II intron reverse transcriptase/maturase [Sporolactobacillus shoreicorticis]|uniref:Group II intron reverse transcriptase/maturase n=1 Tax=Sporolactobacillus shoreicorticis TaxID=1923877 RepID=A0ABW5S8N4_9BACL|nr:group II intron reverse transcriptase/maturase [Sporolactobacillus shoreicorticis]MCO7128207.1 group II intron reverse transcriptase/maturase [Sporolactobacillus shoreicorticis]